MFQGGILSVPKILEIAHHNKIIADKRLKKLFDELSEREFTERFKGWTEDDYKRAGTVWIDPTLATSIDKKKAGDVFPALFDDPNWIVQHKLNGERVTIHALKHYNRIFSRRPSDKTGWLNEKSDLLPHIRDSIFPDHWGTRVDGEILHPSGENKDIGRILRSLPERAWEVQRDKGWLFVVLYDITHWRGFSIKQLPYHERLRLLHKFVFTGGYYRTPFLNLIESVYDCINVPNVGRLTKEGYLKYILSQHGEGIIFKDKNAPYIEGQSFSERAQAMTETRSPYMIKLKDVDTWDLVICGYDRSLSLYHGKEIENDGYWEHWIDKNDEAVPKSVILNASVMLQKGYRPVTKYHARGWIRAIKYGVCVPFEELENLPEPLQDAKQKPYKKGLHIVEVGQCSGMSEEIRQMLSEHGSKHMFRVIEVTANELIDKETGGLKHPRFSRWRDDKAPEQCTWKSHIRE